MEEKYFITIYIILVVLSLPLALGIMACSIIRYEKKLKQEDEENKVVQRNDGFYCDPYSKYRYSHPCDSRYDYCSY